MLCYTNTVTAAFIARCSYVCYCYIVLPVSSHIISTHLISSHLISVLFSSLCPISVSVYLYVCVAVCLSMLSYLILSYLILSGSWYDRKMFCNLIPILLIPIIIISHIMLLEANILLQSVHR